MNFYLESVEEVLKTVGSNESGLTQEKAELRLLKNGKNKLKEGKKTSVFQMFLQQLLEPMIIILMIAAAISGITAAFENEPFTDVFIIMAVVIINSILGVYQESKAEKAIEALQKMTASTSKVLRDGKLTAIKSEDLVVGDVVVLEAGDAVPADGRIIECASMKIEEAALTGESVPVDKIIKLLSLADSRDVPLGDRKNMVYMGSIVVYGRGKAVITATGMDTEMGKIADALTMVEENQTPLQRKLGQLSKTLSFIVIGVCLFIFAFSLFKSGDFSKDVILSTFMIAVSLAVAAIPEGLAAVVTIVLSIGITNMSKRNAVIRKLTAVETLGCAQVICSDKTGTLTQNKMTVVENFSDDEKLLACAMALCSDAQLDETGEAVGEPTECALVNYAYKLGLNKDDLKKEFPRVGEAPFDSVRKMMSTVHSKSEVGFDQYTKGAPDEVLKKCTKIIENGKIIELTDSIRETISKENKKMADKALRVLCAAYKVYDKEPASYDPQELENNLIFIGLAGMIDPIRPEVIDAIKECRMAGIRPIMITGDHKDTAVAIALQLGIIKDSKQAITGSELNGISDEEFKKSIFNYSVYARVQPEHKVRIVKAWRARRMVTAMTGDGVNDAPAIKSADIGVGMGITGTDVTKNVADMILADDNFATIVSAVEEGRRIYSNIRKCIQFLLATNISEVLSILIATILGFTILKPAHLLWINLITDSLPALALGMEEGEGNAMKQRPRSAREGVFAGGMDVDILYQGGVTTLLVLVSYFVGEFIQTGQWHIVASDDGITMAFLTMSMCEIFHSFNMRSRRQSLFTLNRQNVWLWGSAAAAMLLTTTVIEIPALARLFEFTTIDLREYGIAMGLAILIIPIVEIIKAFQRAAARRRGEELRS